MPPVGSSAMSATCSGESAARRHRVTEPRLERAEGAIAATNDEGYTLEGEGGHARGEPPIPAPHERAPPDRRQGAETDDRPGHVRDAECLRVGVQGGPGDRSRRNLGPGRGLRGRALMRRTGETPGAGATDDLRRDQRGPDESWEHEVTAHRVPPKRGYACECRERQEEREIEGIDRVRRQAGVDDIYRRATGRQGRRDLTEPERCEETGDSDEIGTGHAALHGGRLRRFSKDARHGQEERPDDGPHDRDAGKGQFIVGDAERDQQVRVQQIQEDAAGERSPEHRPVTADEPRDAGKRQREHDRGEVGAARLRHPVRRIAIERGDDQADGGGERGEDDAGRCEPSGDPWCES